MKIIIKKTKSEFDALNLKINNAMKSQIKGYSATSWCNPIINASTGYYGLFADVTGTRLTVLTAVLTSSDVVTDVPSTDVTWFPPAPMPNLSGITS